MSASATSSLHVLQSIHADVWHAHALASAPQRVQATGDAALDAQLPGGGWPVGALTEILQPAGLHREWRLLLPALRGGDGGPVLLIGAPYLPFAPALAAQGLLPQRLFWVHAPDAQARLWACEQALRCAEGHAVLAWLPQVRSEALRRLQLAAAQYDKLLFVMRPAAAQADASPAVLRLLVQLQAPVAEPQPAPPPAPAPVPPMRALASSPVPAPVLPPAPRASPDGLALSLLKRRGPPLEKPVYLSAGPAPLQRLLAAAHADALDCPASRG